MVRCRPPRRRWTVETRFGVAGAIRLCLRSIPSRIIRRSLPKPRLIPLHPYPISPLRKCIFPSRPLPLQCINLLSA